MQKMESEQLERLRHANQDLLERLKAKQEEIKKRLPRKPLSASSLSRRTTPAERAVPVPKRGKENQVCGMKGTTDPVTLVSVEPGASAARAALRSPLKPAVCGREGRGVLHCRAGAHPDSLRAERSFTPAASITRETSRVARDGSALRSPEEESSPVEHRESRKQSTMLHGAQERGRPWAEAEMALGRTPAEGSGRQQTAIRDSRTPKSILLTPGGKEAKKEAGRVTFLSDPEEYTIPANSWSARPFLGYDWIAGLLETDSSLSEKSEQYFTELREFRQVNKEACVHEEALGPEAVDFLAPEQEADLDSSSHQCVYCYRINRRLFTIPVDSQSACPVCKTLRARRPPETLEEPAYIRVSIPRSTLLPAYKYKIHRRKSFEPADDLALPSTLITSPQSCNVLENWLYDETSQRCCYQCPSGYHKRKECPTDPDRDCGQCEPEHFLNREQGKPHCKLCVSCKPEYNLVEKVPCSFNSRRVCECRAGLFCKLAIQSSCVQCISHTVCKPGFGVLARGTSEVDVSCQECPSGTFSDRHSSTERCKPHTDCAKLNKVATDSGNSTHDQVCMDPPPTHLTPASLSAKFSNRPKDSDRAEVPLLTEQPMTVRGQHFHTATKPVTSASILMSDAASDDANWTTAGTVDGSDTKHAAGTSPTSDIATEEIAKTGDGSFVPWGAVFLCSMVLLAGMLAVWKRRVCKRRIFTPNGKTLDLYPVTTCRPKSSSQGSDLMKNCAKRFSMLKADKESEERELLNRTPIVETNNNLVSISEKNPGPDSSLTEVIQSTGNATDYPADSRVRDHTNNRIDKIYIMKADTVIVGSISEVPVSKNCAVRGCENDAKAEENMEENELAMHYPQQETESFPGSDVMIPVEEEGKEFHHPTTATEK
uniref:TNFR-Cys domain-containing protein n=1 Tax=Gopherus agassizii TaxID=38772 RepID=A0A452I459_9SAUR